MNHFDRQRFIDAGMDDYLSKPFSRDQLKSVLRQYSPLAPEILREASRIMRGPGG